MQTWMDVIIHKCFCMAWFRQYYNSMKTLKVVRSLVNERTMTNEQQNEKVSIVYTDSIDRVFSTCDQLSRQLEKMTKSEFHNIITGINNLILFVVIYCFQFKKFSGLI